MKTKVGEVRIAEAKERGVEIRTRKEMRRERGKERKRNRSMKNSGRMGDLG